jgi:cell wall-associated NlpC family hydrolase
MADNTHHRPSPAHPRATGSAPSSPSSALAFLSTGAGARQAADAVGQSAVQAQLAAVRQHDAAAAAKSAAAAKKAAQLKAAKAAALLKAARERAAAQAAASRAARRTALHTASSGSSSSASSSSSSAATPSASATASTTVAPASSSRVDQLIAFLKSQLGKPYVYGATGPDSYDCSGLTQAAFASVGVTLPRTSQEQSTVGTPVSTSALQPGDLIFWGGEGSAYHVGVFIGDGQYLDAANSSTPVAIHQLVDYEPDWAVRVL